ncbi:MAG TPA: L,D-transpeptidase family protein [Acidimicrobiales bacterium]|nr:L,D-transpeptidase family protein [Acidimicrobiales bacterium]
MKTKKKRIISTLATLAVAVAGAALVLDLADHDPVADAEPLPPVTQPVDPTTTTTSTTVAPTTTTTIRPTTTTSAPPTTSTTVASNSLRRGDTGAEVTALQRRLRSLGYWLGAVDGSYGYTTEQAVTAFQKVEGLSPDGVAGPATRAALAAADRPSTSAGGDLVEVDKARQVLFVVRDGEVAWTLNVSTGTEKPYYVNGRMEMADTPEGRFKVSWVVDGVDVGELGALYRPRYFHDDGIAVHGYHSVPPYPASHGCVRVTEAAMDWIWADNLMPMGSTVWVH